jgi:pimeloyl-ACP methyl ester carboxylesterase
MYLKLNSNDKVPVYFMPGMAAGPAIFEYIDLSNSQFDMFFLEWFTPEPNMGLEAYAKKMILKIEHSNPVLIGVSFGGMLIQEMAKHMQVRKVVIISSVKCTLELPKKMIFAKYTKVHRLLPTGMINNMELLAKYAFGEVLTQRLRLYEKYLSVRDKVYIDWCIDQTVHWEQKTPPKNLVHIHGELDTVFPIKKIKDCITVKNGSHAMIIHRAKWFNEHLPSIILD